ncbi:hypothetical protein OS493_036288 [Desmophyllum pertusum]|uniref:F5/8 type C domain-containing protein n=1 Tax=Desmophyllum pertusum TaxID=174260 RepID=A0A9W9Z874_9CNID|nr:hypothetical protein OS493_036288 [Desmophyllum pertusum]
MKGKEPPQCGAEVLTGLWQPNSPLSNNFSSSSFVNSRQAFGLFPRPCFTRFFLLAANTSLERENSSSWRILMGSFNSLRRRCMLLWILERLSGSYSPPFCLRTSLKNLARSLSRASTDCKVLTTGDSSFNEAIEQVEKKWFETPSVVSYAACTGDEPFGLESGRITDQQITASSVWKNDHGTANARLNLAAARGKLAPGQPRLMIRVSRLQVDFGRNVKITKVATQGRQDLDEWVKSYSLAYSVDGSSNFQPYQGNEIDQKAIRKAAEEIKKDVKKRVPFIMGRFLMIHLIEKEQKKNVEILKGKTKLKVQERNLKHRYQVLGRTVHMDFVKEHLETKKNVNFGEKQDWPNDIELEILADTVYVKDNIKMPGMKRMTLFSRKVAFVKGSKLDLTSPSLKQQFDALPSPGDDGASGKHGVQGTTVDIFADKVEGYMEIQVKGGPGNGGQNGRNGKRGADSGATVYEEEQAETEGYAGKPGNGGNAGRINIYVREVKGKVKLTTCRGAGGSAAANGKGGDGGNGGQGGRGIRCKYVESYGRESSQGSCKGDGLTDRARQGYDGTKGKDGRALVSAGSNGQVGSDYTKKLKLTSSERQKYPLVLLKLMSRYAEDLIFANKIDKGEDVFKFVITLAKNRNEASEISKVAKRRLAFLNKKGYDRFGNNILFAPLMKWEAFKKRVETIKGRAEEYEKAFNGIKKSIEQQEGIKKVIQAIPQAAKIQVDKEKERLKEARRIAISEKGVYTSSISHLEESMDSSLEQITVLLPSLYKKSKFDKRDLFVILQGLTGFASGIKGGDPSATIGAAIGVAGHFSTKCKTDTLQSNLAKVKNWLKFGKAYRALKDSSELDFDRMDVAAVPEVMKANLEMNKEALAADLVCLLEERLLPRHKAKFEEQVERFFIAGAARIDLIAKIIDLDNAIGGYNFDIPNLEETANEIELLKKIKGWSFLKAPPALPILCLMSKFAPPSWQTVLPK